MESRMHYSYPRNRYRAVPKDNPEFDDSHADQPPRVSVRAGDAIRANGDGVNGRHLEPGGAVEQDRFEIRNVADIE